MKDIFFAAEYMLTPLFQNMWTEEMPFLCMLKKIANGYVSTLALRNLIFILLLDCVLLICSMV
jgi:hypothetical protein